MPIKITNAFAECRVKVLEEIARTGFIVAGRGERERERRQDRHLATSVFGHRERPRIFDDPMTKLDAHAFPFDVVTILVLLYKFLYDLFLF